MRTRTMIGFARRIPIIGLHFLLKFPLVLLLFAPASVTSFPSDQRAVSRSSSNTNNCCQSIATLHVRVSMSAGDYNMGEPDRRWESQRYRQPERERPTKALEELISLDNPSGSPKIVVLGASGRVGRRVVQKLLEMDDDNMLVVGFVRSYDKAIHVLYDDLVLARPKKGPRLQIVEGDLVPIEELPASSYSVVDEEEEEDWRARAESASSFFGTKMKDYDNRHLLPDINEVLEEAIRDASIIISCVGDVRKTNLWKDAIQRPFVRLLGQDVSRWCSDRTHPYFVHFSTTRKALGYAEREQIRREASLKASAEAQGMDATDLHVPRLRFVRISDNSVSQPPWQFIPLVTNMLHSMVFKYQEMAENLLLQSSLVDSVIIRPGDLVDDERDPDTTWVQVSSLGRVESPSRVGRDDVAALVVAAALKPYDNSTDPFHYTVAMRWVGPQMGPYPQQGIRTQGAKDPATALTRAFKMVKREASQEERRRRTKARMKHKKGQKMLPTPTYTSSAGLKTKPYGVCVAVPLYFFLTIFFKAILRPIVSYVPGLANYIKAAEDGMTKVAAAALSFVWIYLKKLLPWMVQRKRYISF